MRLENRSTIDDATVRDVLRFIVPSSVTRYDLTVYDDNKPGRTYSGHAKVCTSEWHVLLRIGPASSFPTLGGGVRGPGHLDDPYIVDRIEALVFVAAHEFRHLWQTLVPRGRRVWGARGRYSERDADAYALRMLRAWRRRSSTEAVA